MTINVTPLSGEKVLTAGNWYILAQCPAGAIMATMNARAISLNLAADVKIRMAVVPAGMVDGAADGGAGTPTDAQLLQPKDIILGPNGIAVGILEDSAIVLKPGECIVAYSDNGHAVGRAHGLVRTST